MSVEYTEQNPFIFSPLSSLLFQGQNLFIDILLFTVYILLTFYSKFTSLRLRESINCHISSFLLKLLWCCAERAHVCKRENFVDLIRYIGILRFEI